jgi:hypothetical protein
VTERAYQLVIQRPVEDLDGLIELEDAIREQLGDAGEVDGHDIGVGESNVFVLTDQPKAAFERLRALVAALPSARAAYRRLTSSEWTILYPPGLKDFEVA